MNDADASTLLDWLLRKYPDTPRSRAKQWIETGRVSLDGTIIRKPHQRMADPGEMLELRARDAIALEWDAGWQIHPRVTLLYLDTALAVVSKGAGLLAVPGPEAALSALSILADFLAGRLRAQHRRVVGKTLPAAWRHLEPLPVHRLDQYTTGVFCMATNPAARHHLIEQLKAHTMSREYIGYVEGRPPAANGTWRHWLQTSRNSLHQRVLSENEARRAGPEAREAIMHYQLVASYPLAGGQVASKLRFRLETGRTHQIRVQAAAEGLPLLGDRAYNPHVREPERTESSIDFPRQALHAERLSLEHPDQPDRRMSWAAELPKDLRQLESRLRSGGRE